MRWNKPGAWSLDHSTDLIFLCAASAVGVGNFYVMPRLVVESGGLAILLVHLLGLLFLGGVLLLTEFIFSRWLLRPYMDSFHSLDSRLGGLALLSIMAIGFILPPYTMELGRILSMTLGAIMQSGYIPTGEYDKISKSMIQSYLCGALVFVGMGLCAFFRPVRLVKIFKILLLFSITSWVLIAGVLNYYWGSKGLKSLLFLDFASLKFESVFRTLGFSLFTLTAGFGVMYTFTFYSSQAPIRQSSHKKFDLWTYPGALLYVAICVIGFDFLSSLASIAFVAPFYSALNSISGFKTPADIKTVILEQLPQILVRLPHGPSWVLLLLLSFLSAGTASALSLIEFEVFSLEREMNWSRRRAAAHVIALGLLALTLPLIPAVHNSMSWLGADIFLPLSALALCWVVGWRMPLRAKQQLFGRGLILDSLFRLWSLSVRYIVPVFLIYYLLRQLITGF